MHRLNLTCTVESVPKIISAIYRYYLRPGHLYLINLTSSILINLSTSLSNTLKLFYLQDKSSSGDCLGTQPMVVTSIHQATIYPNGRYFVATDISPVINLVFSALLDLIICRTTQMGLHVPSAAESCTLDAIFAEKVPKINI